MADGAVTVLVVDDAVSFGESLTEVLNQRLGEKGWRFRYTGHWAVDAAVRDVPDYDVALVDLSLRDPSFTGLDVLARLSVLSPTTKLVLLTIGDLNVGSLIRLAFVDERWELAGALHKESGLDVLVSGLRRIVAGEAVVHHSFKVFQPAAGDRKWRTIRKAVEDLPQAHRTVLRLLLEATDRPSYVSLAAQYTALVQTSPLRPRGHSHETMKKYDEQIRGTLEPVLHGKPTNLGDLWETVQLLHDSFVYYLDSVDGIVANEN